MQLLANGPPSEEGQPPASLAGLLFLRWSSFRFVSLLLRFPVAVGPHASWLLTGSSKVGMELFACGAVDGHGLWTALRHR